MKIPPERLQELEEKLIHSATALDLDIKEEGEMIYVNMTVKGRALKGSINARLEHFTFGLAIHGETYKLYFVADPPERLGGTETMEVEVTRTLHFKKGRYESIVIKSATNELTKNL